MRKLTTADFWARVRKTDWCWLYEGPSTPKGYGKVSQRYAHQLSYEEHIGPIPEGKEIDHRCRVRNCVNPEHLEAVTHAVNVRRGSEATKTHCKHGHPLSGDNLYIRKEGWRMCKACVNRISTRISRRKRAEAQQ